MTRENINKMGQDTINKFTEIGNDLFNTVLDTTLPIINNIGGTELVNPIRQNENPIIYSNNTHIYYAFFLPGVSKEHLKLILSKGTLTVSGTTSFINERLNVGIDELNYKKTIKVPSHIKKSNLKTSYENGVLTVICNNNIADIDEEEIPIN
uniref:SHSP domain-containing protein n=1 Tax=viral metagenome TaxID=1070528 RepID=A0A6C0J070_9ZZZZ